ncbi:hypothetical protein GCM10025868_29320 [Angustibacter aerolatus]|uniref:Uncharacterized protein n=1 Tax=Angustibacter aerolatus TaxID=1162965 RepID=A0ABQ6JIU7_9ACTN|nr:hypothetical protein GCM10025868_29320 [Angustibacter aerolatus]
MRAHDTAARPPLLLPADEPPPDEPPPDDGLPDECDDPLLECEEPAGVRRAAVRPGGALGAGRVLTGLAGGVAAGLLAGGLRGGGPAGGGRALGGGLAGGLGATAGLLLQAGLALLSQPAPTSAAAMRAWAMSEVRWALIEAASLAAAPARSAAACRGSLEPGSSRLLLRQREVGLAAHEPRRRPSPRRRCRAPGW